MLQITYNLSENDALVLTQYFDTHTTSNWTIQESRDEEDVFLRGYFDSQTELEKAEQKLKGEIPEIFLESKIEHLPDCNWQDEYKKHFQPWTINSMHWVPAWKRDHYQVPVDETAIFLDPGMAFGMMDHPSTHLCMQILMDFYRTWVSP